MKTWQQQLKNSFKSTDELLDFLEIPENKIKYISPKNFPIRVPLSFAKRMEKGNPKDPLLLQALPLGEELINKSGFSLDPLQENNCKINPISGLLHKYHARVLLTLTSACAIHCRYCFRRHFPYEENNPGTAGWSKALDYIKENTDIREVILSGGDPLSVSDELLENFIKKLEKISHVNYLRIHTRWPIVIPDRVTDKLLNILIDSRFKVVIVLHCNHPNEINSEVESALLKLKQANIVLLNQAVLLNNINNNVQNLLDLSYRLFNNGALPYYLHLLDKVSGASHFEVDKPQAVRLITKLTEQLPGYLVPKLVYEAAGQRSKVPVDLGLDN